MPLLLLHGARQATATARTLVADDNLTPSASVSGCRFSPKNSLIDARKTIRIFLPLALPTLAPASRSRAFFSLSEPARSISRCISSPVSVCPFAKLNSTLSRIARSATTSAMSTCASAPVTVGLISWPLASSSTTWRHHSPSVKPPARWLFQPRVLFLAHFESDGFGAQRRLHHLPSILLED